MESKSLQPVKDNNPVTTGVPSKLQWANFIADVWFKCWVLMLVTVGLLGGMAVVWFVVWYGKDPTGAIVGSITAAAIAGLSKVFHSFIKPTLGARKED
jgi:hypothetical protein